MIVNFTRMGPAVPDHQAEQRALAVARGYNQDGVFATSSMVMVRAFQTLIAEGKIAPDRVHFQYEGRDMNHDHLGRVTSAPIEYTAAYDVLTNRFIDAVRRKAVDAMTEEQRQQLTQIYQSWFDIYIQPEFGEGREFLYIPQAQGQSRVIKLDGHTRFKVLGWGMNEYQRPVMVAEVVSDSDKRIIGKQAPFSVSELTYAAFDDEGFRIVPEAFDEAAAYKQVGLDPSTLKPRWDNIPGRDQQQQQHQQQPPATS